MIYEVGDYVYLKLQPYRQTTVAFHSFLKLALQFFGSYKVLTRVGPIAYKLEFLAGSQIHDFFYVSLLKPKLESITPVSLTFHSSIFNSPL